MYFGQHMIHVPELSEKPYLIKSNSLVQILTDRDLNRKLKKWTIWNWLWISLGIGLVFFLNKNFINRMYNLYYY